MGSRFVFWPRRHSVARVHKVGDWMGLGAPNPVVTPFEAAGVLVGGGSPGEPVARGGGSPGEPVMAARGLRLELERANGAVVGFRRPGRPRKVRGV